MSRFPWQALMAAGMGTLGHPSDAFWKMSLRELSAAIDAQVLRVTPPDRAVLDDLMRRFPDRNDAKRD